MNISIQNYKQSHLNSLRLKKNSMRNLQAVNTASIFEIICIIENYELKLRIDNLVTVSRMQIVHKEFECVFYRFLRYVRFYPDLLANHMFVYCICIESYVIVAVI